MKKSKQQAMIQQEITFQKLIMGLRLDESMDSVLKYVNFLSRILNFKEIDFLHVAPFYNPGMNPYLGNPITGYPIGKIYSEDAWKRDEKELTLLKQGLLEVVKNAWDFDADTTLHYVLREGAPLEELINQATEQNADLVVVGKSADTNRHQISAKNIIRQTTSNVLLVPENAPTVLERILVPFDFSDHSIRALELAVAVKKSMPSSPTIQVLHIYQRPDYHPFVLRPTDERVRDNGTRTNLAGFENFLAERLPEIRKHIHPISLEKGSKNIAYYLLEKAKEYNSNLIIVGAKGHSKLDLLLMGSTVERLVNKNDSIPMLVVK